MIESKLVKLSPEKWAIGAILGLALGVTACAEHVSGAPYPTGVLEATVSAEPVDPARYQALAQKILRLYEQMPEDQRSLDKLTNDRSVELRTPPRDGTVSLAGLGTITLQEGPADTGSPAMRIGISQSILTGGPGLETDAFNLRFSLHEASSTWQVDCDDKTEDRMVFVFKDTVQDPIARHTFSRDAANANRWRNYLLEQGEKAVAAAAASPAAPPVLDISCAPPPGAKGG